MGRRGAGRRQVGAEQAGPGRPFARLGGTALWALRSGDRKATARSVIRTMATPGALLVMGVSGSGK